MNRRGKIRLSVMVLLGMLFGLYLQHNYAKWNRLGREAFLVSQERRFDTSIADPKPLALDMYGGVFVAVLLFGSYEGVVFLISSVAGWIFPDDKNRSRTGPNLAAGAQSS